GRHSPEVTPVSDSPQTDFGSSPARQEADAPPAEPLLFRKTIQRSGQGRPGIGNIKHPASKPQAPPTPTTRPPALAQAALLASSPSENHGFRPPRPPRTHLSGPVARHRRASGDRRVLRPRRRAARRPLERRQHPQRRRWSDVGAQGPKQPPRMLSTSPRCYALEVKCTRDGSGSGP